MKPPLPDLLQDTDADAIASWMDNYCRAHPLDPIDTAADQLAAELLKRKSLRKP
jgi:hypothetical protein